MTTIIQILCFWLTRFGAPSFIGLIMWLIDPTSMGVKRVVRRRGFVYVRVCFLLAVFFLRNPQKKKQKKQKKIKTQKKDRETTAQGHLEQTC